MFFKLDLKNKAFSGRRSSREMRIAFRGDLLIVIRSSREMRIAFRGDLDCRVASLLAMTQREIASLRSSQ